MLNVKDFINQCESSSQNAYDAFKSLLLQLENKSTRNAALSFFHELRGNSSLQISSEKMMKQFHFSISELKLKDKKLTLIQLPSTFAPEEWSFTFFEGLLRYKTAEFEDRNVVELGCGIGWISMALAMHTKPKKILGLDINPRAVTCARINLYLNAYDEKGLPRWQSGGLCLDDIVEFHVSNLLEYCRNRKMDIDRVIGCIPQVLNPDPEFTAKMLKGDISENSSDEFLHSLSNYAPQQGQIEDQFGLGLIAKAVEESVYVLKNSGKIILNLGGRPGRKVLEQLFLRRGFSVRQVWKTKVEQAKDTDIRALVEIEKRSSHRFEFYVDAGGDTPISASTALAYADSGGEIYHALMVFEAKMRDPSHLPQIIKTIGMSGYESARNAMDLSYIEEELVEEKASFLSALSLELNTSQFFPYQKTSGFEVFRKNLVRYFKNYYHIDLSVENIMITPSRLVTCRNILTLYKPKRAFIDRQLSSSYFTDCGELIETPPGAELICDMIQRLKPDLVIYSMSEVEARSSDALLRMIEISSKSKTRLFIDISDFFELSSAPPQNGVFRYLENQMLPSHVSLICGLVKNKIYADLQVSFVLSSNQQFVSHLTNTAELTYSRTPFLSQFYYNCILNDLLSFQVMDEARNREQMDQNFLPFEEEGYISIAQCAKNAFAHPAIVSEQKSQSNDKLIRLDYGENCLPAPQEVKHILFESFAHQSIPTEDCDPTVEIIEYLSSFWSFKNKNSIRCLLSGGVAPIFSEMARYCAQMNETMIFPCGSYGYFVASAEFHCAKVEKVQTKEAKGFKVDIVHLEELLKKSHQINKRSWVILSAPIVNPTGAIYTASEVREITGLVEKYNGVLVLDSVFSGLGFYEGEEIIKVDVLGQSHWIILGGLSKEFAAGGLRVGYAISPNENLIQSIRACELTSPHKTLSFTLKKIYQVRNQVKASLDFQRQKLLERSILLTKVLSESGWKVLESRGGLFLIAKPESLLGCKVKGLILTENNLSQVLRSEFNLVINSSEWIGLPSYYRFVLSVSDSDFEKAIEKLRSFSALCTPGVRG